MHCMMIHVSQFMEIHGALLPFPQHGLENYNDCMTKDYFRSSSHRGQECLVQIMNKQNRIEHLEHSGAKREKRFSIMCSNCGKQGHNKTTCTGHYTVCNHVPFCSHIVNISGKNIPQCQVNTINIHLYIMHVSHYFNVYIVNFLNVHVYNVYTQKACHTKLISFFLFPSPRTNLKQDMNFVQRKLV